ncbi:MAG TPA: HisA/HisF-related TIM barrel protein [Methyloceanibacter sp.]|nr:HisA/HisF-related TIM barrel protein [Methyloceanibacter sp.]
MTEFTIIPALDLKDGLVVHAKGGSRADYAPAESPFGAADDPVAIARGLLAATGSPVLYIADLDAISGTGNHFELVRGLADALQGTALWIDAGFSDVADCAFWLPLGATLVIGSESVASVEDWQIIRDAFAGVVLSLDFDAGGRRGPDALFDDPALWPERIIVMSLAKVGAGEGPDLERIKTVIGTADEHAVYAAGGVRDAQDLTALAALGARGVLVGTSLHSGAVTQNKIAALLRERRP